MLIYKNDTPGKWLAGKALMVLTAVMMTNNTSHSKVIVVPPTQRLLDSLRRADARTAASPTAQNRD